MALVYCYECGKQFSEHVENCPHCGYPNQYYVKQTNNSPISTNAFQTPQGDIIGEPFRGKWSNAKLIIGIFSMIAFFIIISQSCFAEIGNTLARNKDISTTSGIMLAFAMLLASIISIITRNSKSQSGCGFATAIYWIGFLITVGSIGGTYRDLILWGCVSFFFGLINFGSIIASAKQFNNSSASRVLAFLVAIISIAVFLLGISATNIKRDTNLNNTNSVISDIEISQTAKRNPGLGDTFVYNNLEITVEDNITFTTIDNPYSKYNGMDIIKVPITVKNLDKNSKTLELYHFTTFGSKGCEIDSMYHFFDDSIEKAGLLRTGASYTRFLYLSYDGDGEYAIEFGYFSEQTTITFDVKKPS